MKARQAELATAKKRLLDQANGGSFGTLDRELIDIKNTDSFLLGIGEGTVSGIVDTGKAIGALAQKGVNKLLGRTSQTIEPTTPPLTPSEQRLLDNERDLQLDVMRIQDGATANRLIGRTAGGEIIAPIVTAEVGGAVIGRAGAVLGRGAGEESALLGKFGPGEGSVTSSLRGKTKLLSDGRTALGPETTVAGKAVNLTTDNAMAIAPDGPFTVGAHATADSLNFFADAEASQLLSTRAVAIRMWKNGYRGGDVKLISCECGQNAGLVKGLRRELNGLTLDKPVGVIAAPTTVVNGMGELQPGGVWKLFEN